MSRVGNGVTMLPRFILNKRNNFIFVRILTLESISQGWVVLYLSQKKTTDRTYQG